MENNKTENALEQEKTVQKPKKEKQKKKKDEITFKVNKKGRHIHGVINFLRCILIPLYWTLKPFKFYGNKKVKDGACVYVCNHYTMFDAIFPAATTWEGIHFVAKKENFDTPIIGPILRKIKGISASRDGSDVRTVLDCFKCLKNGDKISIFPEGTRNKSGEGMLPFHHGAAMMAIKTKSPIVPMIIYKKPKFFRMTHVVVGEPFELTEYYDRRLTAEEASKADDYIREVMLELRRKHTEYLENKKKKKVKKA